jgi:xanthine dehydrogenase YagR molybdenum-binding subunit
MTVSPMGRATDRVEGPLKVTGRAPYAADYAPAGLVHGHLVLATIARGSVRSMDISRAEAAPGVIGHALLESDPLEPDGRFAAANMADYLVPVHADIPEIDVHWLDQPDPNVSEFGGRGLGELGMVGSAAAIGNAVFNATGIGVRDLPITVDKLL